MSPFILPDSGSATTRSRVGGDSSVERDGRGNPRIIVGCDTCDGSGTVPSPKTGKAIKCKPCGGAGANKKVSYTRTTTFIDVLDSKDNIAAWKMRKVLTGTATDPSLLDGVLEYDDTEREGRDWLNRRAEVAAVKGGANAASEQGTYLHDLSEVVDSGKPLPDDVVEVDRLDIEAYRQGTVDLVDIHLMEKLTVNDELRVAGTPDRVSYPKVMLTAPDGTRISPEDKIITDLKTGRVDYGALKMAMQLSIYSRSHLYHQDGMRQPIEGLRNDWGLIMHLPVGKNELTVYWADLRLGWRAVQIAREVRGIRKEEKNALTALCV